ncbi:MAG: four helix bundle protein [Flavobacteriaceae bacterium]|nr:four helix bundle protein [Flavobacteriaceae bacterium]
MGKVNSFEELNIWIESRSFNQKLYKISNNGIFDKDYDLKRQIRRASISVSSNIAEDFERNTDKEFIQFLYYAKGSAGEVRSQLFLSLDLNYIQKKDFDELYNQITGISKMISGMIKYLKKIKVNKSYV